jgi:perosamine synthetase
MQVPILRIPFTSESRQFLHDGLDDILDSGALTMGRQTARFEELFSGFTGATHAVACSNGTAALELILRGLDIEGRDVLVPTNTFLATALAVIHSGNRVVLCDADPETLCLDYDDVVRRLTPDTAAIILVHIGGVITPDVRRLQHLCSERGLALIEDCAHAHGCSIDGQQAGTLGVAGAFSFFPTKVLTTGEGGIVTTSDEHLAARIRSLRNHGKNPAMGGRMSELGNNHRMSELTALLGVQQMENAARVIEERQRAAAYYDGRLAGMARVRPLAMPRGVVSTYYKYVVHLDEGIDRDALKAAMKARHGVSLTGEVYADPCHTEPVWKHYTYCGTRRDPARPCEHGDPCTGAVEAAFPGAERIAKHHICLPLYPGITEEEMAHVTESLAAELTDRTEVA